MGRYEGPYDSANAIVLRRASSAAVRSSKGLGLIGSVCSDACLIHRIGTQREVQCRIHAGWSINVCVKAPTDILVLGLTILRPSISSVYKVSYRARPPPAVPAFYRSPISAHRCLVSLLLPEVRQYRGHFQLYRLASRGHL